MHIIFSRKTGYCLCLINTNRGSSDSTAARCPSQQCYLINQGQLAPLGELGIGKLFSLFLHDQIRLKKKKKKGTFPKQPSGLLNTHKITPQKHRQPGK